MTETGKCIDLPPAVRAFLANERLGEVVAAEAIEGGAISRTRRLFTASGAAFVLKQADDAPPDMYALEAEGLRTLAVPGGPHLPQVFSVGPDHLLLEDLRPLPPPEEEAFWRAFGHALAALHRHRSDRFGFSHDNYLGRLPQWNGWMDDGHDFFVRNRLLRYLDEPLTQETLTPEDRRDLERLCGRFRDLVPAQPACLLHGDLWCGNKLAAPNGGPAAIDPAVYYGWPEAELSMARQYGGAPQAFFDAYTEVHPLNEGWWERLELLYLREQLSMIAHLGDRYGTREQLREVVRKFF